MDKKLNVIVASIEDYWLNIEVWSKDRNIMVRIPFVQISEEDKKRILKATQQILKLTKPND